MWGGCDVGEHWNARWASHDEGVCGLGTGECHRVDSLPLPLGGI